jgi:hypothetical protein
MAMKEFGIQTVCFLFSFFEPYFWLIVTVLLLMSETTVMLSARHVLKPSILICCWRADDFRINL